MSRKKCLLMSRRLGPIIQLGLDLQATYSSQSCEINFDDIAELFGRRFTGIYDDCNPETALFKELQWAFEMTVEDGLQDAYPLARKEAVRMVQEHISDFLEDYREEGALSPHQVIGHILLDLSDLLIPDRIEYAVFSLRPWLNLHPLLSDIRYNLRFNFPDQQWDRIFLTPG